MLPRDLPKLRDQTLRHLDDRTSDLRADTSAEVQPGFDALAWGVDPNIGSLVLGFFMDLAQQSCTWAYHGYRWLFGNQLAPV